MYRGISVHNSMAKIKIALLSGGVSGEREISLKTGEQIYNALIRQRRAGKNKHQIFRYDPKTDLKKIINDAIDKKFDLVFPALHGPFGEDGKLQGMLDMIGMPYVFSDCLASALAMNKNITKIIAKKAGLEVARDIILTKIKKYNTKKIIEKLSLPIVIKPMELGSSVGMSIARNEKELKEGVKKAFKYDSKIMLEQFIKGRELTVAVMGNEKNAQALPVIEIIPKISDWFDYRAKYEVGGSDEICPAKIPDSTRKKIQDLAIKIFKTIGCKDVARVDFICGENDKLYFIEINTIPGMTKISLVPQAAKVAGMEFSEFLDTIIQYNV